jgi:hypothetical protein
MNETGARLVYDSNEGSREMSELLGGKGANGPLTGLAFSEEAGRKARARRAASRTWPGRQSMARAYPTLGGRTGVLGTRETEDR